MSQDGRNCQAREAQFLVIKYFNLYFSIFCIAKTFDITDIQPIRKELISLTLYWRVYLDRLTVAIAREESVRLRQEV